MSRRGGDWLLPQDPAAYNGVNVSRGRSAARACAVAASQVTQGRQPETRNTPPDGASGVEGGGADGGVGEEVEEERHPARRGDGRTENRFEEIKWKRPHNSRMRLKNLTNKGLYRIHEEYGRLRSYGNFWSGTTQFPTCGIATLIASSCIPVCVCVRRGGESPMFLR